VPTIRLFASAREAAGTVGVVLVEARRRYGTTFADILPTCRVWVNGEPAGEADAVGDKDEVAVLPPVSGGAW
jgi:molybdopterin synthase sulfur carrier subunit